VVDRVLCLLDEEERQTVRGDLAESGENVALALRDVLGLVFRRQCLFWSGWRPWFALMLLVLPMGILIPIASRNTADYSAIFLWLIVNNANPTLLHSAGYWYTALQALPVFLPQTLVLACWAWAGGLLIGNIARRAVWLLAVVLSVVLLFAVQHALAGRLAFNAALDVGGNAAAFKGGFYRVEFPLLVICLFVFFPLVLGMRRGLRAGNLSAACRMAVWISFLLCGCSVFAGIPAYGLLRIWTPPPVTLLLFTVGGYLLLPGSRAAKKLSTPSTT
jgi:hypothetical protein